MVKDYGLIATFDKADLGKMYSLARRLRETQDENLAQHYLDCCERRRNDHNTVLEFGSEKLEFTDVIKSIDMAVNGGLQQCINISLGTSAVRWTHIAYGNSGFTSASVTDTALFAELGRINMTTVGWTLQLGMKMFFGGVIGETISVGAGLDEIGVFNASSGGTMLNRNAFDGNDVSRTTGTAVIMLSSVVELCPTVA